MTSPTITQLLRKASAFRTAVRVYDDRQVAREDMELLLDLAHQSPSSVGLEGWRFLATDNKALDAQLKADLKAVAWGAQPQFDTASHMIFLVAEKDARYDSQSIHQSLIRRGLTSEEDLSSRLSLYQAFQERDMAIADNPRALLDWTAKQTYIAMGTMMTAAALMGLDTCPIEGFHFDRLNAIMAEAGYINPAKEAVVCLLSVGYRLRDPKHPKARKPRSEVVAWLTDQA